MNGWHFIDEDDQLGVPQVQQSSEDVGPPITMVEAPNMDEASHNQEVSSLGDPSGPRGLSASTFRGGRFCRQSSICSWI